MKRLILPSLPTVDQNAIRVAIHRKHEANLIDRLDRAMQRFGAIEGHYGLEAGIASWRAIFTHTLDTSPDLKLAKTHQLAAAHKLLEALEQLLDHGKLDKMLQPDPRKVRRATQAELKDIQRLKGILVGLIDISVDEAQRNRRHTRRDVSVEPHALAIASIAAETATTLGIRGLHAKGLIELRKKLGSDTFRKKRATEVSARESVHHAWLARSPMGVAAQNHTALEFARAFFDKSGGLFWERLM